MRSPRTASQGLCSPVGAIMAAVALVALTLGLSACSGGSEKPVGAGTASQPAPVKPSGDPVQPPTASPDPRMQVRACPGPVAAEAQQVVEAQIVEFSQGRFKRAFAYASDEFRENIQFKEFRTIIKEDYPFLLDNPKVTFTGCVERDGKAYAQVSLAGESVTVLTYRLVRNADETLAIDAATISAVSMDPNV